MRRAPPADDHATEHVDDEADIRDARPGRDERQIGDPEPVRRGRCELPVDEIRVPRGGRIRPRRRHALRTGRALDARCAHEPAGLVSTDLDPRTAGALPELTDPVNAIIRLPEPDEPRRHNSVADRPRRRRTILRGVIGARSYLQQTADGLDSERATLDDVVLVRVDERDYFRCWRSSSAPKKDAARFKISLARRSSRFSCSSSRTLCASSVLTPGA